MTPAAQLLSALRAFEQALDGVPDARVAALLRAYAELHRVPLGELAAALATKVIACQRARAVARHDGAVDELRSTVVMSRTKGAGARGDPRGVG